MPVLDIATLLASSSEVTTPDGNQSLSNFVPFGADIESVSPQTATCFLAQAVSDETPAFRSPVLVHNYHVVQGFMNGVLTPVFASSIFDESYDQSGPSADESTRGVRTTCNILVNGGYEGA